MKFAIATVAYWDSIGFDTTHWRKSLDGRRAICHLDYAKKLGTNLYNNPEVKIYDSIDPELKKELGTGAWIPDGTSGDLDIHDFLDKLRDLEDKMNNDLNTKMSKVEDDLTDSTTYLDKKIEANKQENLLTTTQLRQNLVDTKEVMLTDIGLLEQEVMGNKQIASDATGLVDQKTEKNKQDISEVNTQLQDYKDSNDTDKLALTTQLQQNQKRVKNMLHIDFIEDCGGIGDGVVNNYGAFITLAQLVRNNGGYCRVLFPPGEYSYKPLLPLPDDWRTLVQIEGLSHIYYSGYGATIKQVADINWNANGTPAGLHEHESPFQFRSTSGYNCHSIVMEGLEIVGDRIPYTGVDGSCSGIYLRAVEKFVGRDLTVSGWGTDGVTVGRNYGNGAKCQDVIFNNIVCDNNTRQGMSVTGCDHFIISDSTFKNTNGGSFGHGLDFETNVGRQRNARVTNCRFENNERGALNFIDTYDVVVEGCHIDEPNTNGAFYFDSNTDFAENIIIKNTTVVTDKAVVYLGGRKVKDVKFIDCDFTTTGRSNDGATIRFVPPADNVVDKIKFENCLFKGLTGILTRIKGAVIFSNCDFEISNVSNLSDYPFTLNVENEGIFISNRFNIAEDVVFSSRYFTIKSGTFDNNEMMSHSGSLVRLVDDRYDLGQYTVEIGRNKFSEHFYYLGEVYALNATTDTRIIDITALGRVVHGGYTRTTSGKNARVGDVVSFFTDATNVLRTYRCTSAGSPGVWVYQ